MLFPLLYILELGLANFFWDHVIQISIRQMDFKYIFPKYEKLEFFVETFAPYNQILIFQEKLCMSNIFFIFLILTIVHTTFLLYL